MELIDYVANNFIPRSKLLESAGVDSSTLVRLQEMECMPAFSYLLDHSVKCSSPIAEFGATETTEYYAKGYCDWLATVAAIGDSARSFEEFASRYSERVKLLLDNGLGTAEKQFLSGLGNHMREEWRHFLNGTYGVCTKTGLPEDIATKELSASRIVSLISQVSLDENSLAELKSVVDLMDSVCAEFAPHERAHSSRKRLIVDVRLKYKLQTEATRIAT